MEQWYFTKDGQQDGPVTSAQIKALTKAGQLDPDSTHIWSEGMSEWQLLKDSELFEESISSGSALPAPDLAKPISNHPYPATAVAYQAPVRKDYEVEAQYPGYGRLRYFLTSLIFTFILYAFLFLMMYIAFKSSSNTGAMVVIGFLLSMVISMIVGFYIAYQRVINLGMSGLAVLWCLVPFMNIWIAWRMLVCPEGYEYHRTLDTAGKVLNYIFIGFFALAVVVNILAVFMQG